MNTHGVIEVFFSGAHLNRNRESLHNLTSIRAEVVESHYSILISSVNDQLAESGFLSVFF